MTRYPSCSARSRAGQRDSSWPRTARAGSWPARWASRRRRAPLLLLV